MDPLYGAMYAFNMNILWKRFKTSPITVDKMFDFGFLPSFKKFTSITNVHVLVKVFFVHGFHATWHAEVIPPLLN